MEKNKNDLRAKMANWYRRKTHTRVGDRGSEIEIGTACRRIS